MNKKHKGKNSVSVQFKNIYSGTEKNIKENKEQYIILSIKILFKSINNTYQIRIRDKEKNNKYN